MEIILYKFNHNAWFGKGHFHIKSIEGIWNGLKI